MSDLNPILTELGLSLFEIQIYQKLSQKIKLRASQISAELKINRSTTYNYLKRLKKYGLVHEISSGHSRSVRYFCAESPERIKLLIKERQQNLSSLEFDYLNILPKLLAQNKTKYFTPSFEVFQGEVELREALRDMIFYRELETLALWPIHNMLDILSPEFFSYLNKMRIKNSLYTRAIWSKNQAVDVDKYPYLGIGAEFMREIRIAPKNVDFNMGYWIYGDKVVFISSKSESFGFSIVSQEFVELLKTQFEMLWKKSKAITKFTQRNREFLSSV
ncbi:MAG: helix-turn-helix domain-containing protein [Patescibacteria group bacterium]